MSLTSKVDTWDELLGLIRQSFKSKKLTKLHAERLSFEVKQIDVQGANRYWVDIYNAGNRYSKNPNYLIIPWLLGLLEGEADIDPVLNRPDAMVTSTHYKTIVEYQKTYNKLPVDIVQDKDVPDIDIDCLPVARKAIKAYAESKYGKGNVCSVGTMQSFLFKQAIIDSARALSLNPTTSVANAKVAGELTKHLPETVNEMREGGYSVCKGKIYLEGGIESECKTVHNEAACPKCGGTDFESPTFHALLAEHEALNTFYNASDYNRDVIDTALGLIGKYRNSGTHAGALIIADRKLMGNIPMFLAKDEWASYFTEGRSPQLSKLGYNKWDILGLMTLEYIYQAAISIKKNHGVDFGDCLKGFDYADPTLDRAGVYWKDGQQYDIPLNDPKALALVNSLKTESIFQFDTNFARQILRNKVYDFFDLLAMNALGHPGPSACIPWYGKVKIEGGEIPIKDLKTEKLAFYNNNQKLDYTEHYTLFKSGNREIYRVEFDDGSTLDVTSDHLLLTLDGYKTIKELHENDHVIATED